MDITRKQLEEEIAEKTADLQAFLQSRDILWKRCVETRDSGKTLFNPMHEWAGTHALMNSFDVFIHNVERTIEELKALRDNVVEKPRLRIVRSEDEQGPADAT